MTSVATGHETREVAPFTNEPLTDFSRPEHAAAQEAALKRAAEEFGKTYPLVIGGTERVSEQIFASINPAHPDQVVARFASATVAEANEAVEQASAYFKTWSSVPVEQRAQYVLDAAAKLRERRFDFNAYLIYEVGKSWVEADADIAEAIDFCEFYAREALRIGGNQPLHPITGEKNFLRYIPLGVGVVIPPWNFAAAIMIGLTTSALVTGNTVVLKPASTAAWIAAKFVELLYEVGVPKAAVSLVTGSGGVVGDALVQHPLTRFVSFTGSREVGLRINELAAKPQAGQKWIKRAVLEMGGKDSIVVDESADLDAAATAIVVSAFGFQGQKCSACSRAIITADVYDQVLDKVVEKTKTLSLGDTTSQATYMGPVIDENAYKKILGYIEKGKTEGRLLIGGATPAREGYFIEPTVIADVSPTATIAQEEIFGPVLAVIKAKDFDEAMEIANNTDYGLTGSFFSRLPDRIERAEREFFVGNFYVNRKSTGAMVGAHPFGGFNMSGTDSKAGGQDYLLLFTQGKAISEKVG
ncbi:MAG TPA: L-glutamate gamma-semialdehyde dehydrogenase [Ktedonobacterales bacterium]